jgi:hypothetical protein
MSTSCTFLLSLTETSPFTFRFEMDNGTTPSQYHGVNTSLYAGLHSQTVKELERAIYLGNIGHYDRARSIFDNELLWAKSVPVVAIERAELALRQGRFRESWDVLDKVLADISSNSAPDADEGVSRLMRIFHAMAAINCKGTLELAKEEIRLTREWLWDTPVSTYTDVQVCCAPKRLGSLCHGIVLIP